MKTIPLTQGKVALVDNEDYEKISKYNWCLSCLRKDKYKTKMYAVRKGGVGEKTQVRMHRQVLGDYYIDHINGNGLDNRKKNLRVCTIAQNLMNSVMRKNNTSGYRGVSEYYRKKAWIARLGYKYLGYYRTKELAARAYDTAAKEKFGEFARLNFPKKGEPILKEIRFPGLRRRTRKNALIAKNKKVPFKGVSIQKNNKSKPYMATFHGNYIGYFKTAEEAAKAYDREARKKYGNLARPNFPNKTT